MDQKFKFATWNIDQARREEKYEATKFDTRWPLIQSQIRECNADILCLQELRNLETSSVTINSLLYEVSQMGYDCHHAFYGPASIAFCLAIFYKRDKFFPIGLDLQLLPLGDESKPNMSTVILTLKLRVISSGRVFTVSNTHFGLDEEEKSKAVQFLAHYLCGMKRYLCAGDFNFFDDREGLNQRTVLLLSNNDLAYPLKNASGTFMGYEHDAFKQPFEKMSRLDHVFTDSILRVGETAYAFGDMELVKTRQYPSDHLMITFDFII